MISGSQKLLKVVSKFTFSVKKNSCVIKLLMRIMHYRHTVAPKAEYSA